jgi:hypothetical protein
MPDQPGHLGVGKSGKTVWDQVRPQFGIPWRSLKYVVPPFYSFIFILLELQLISAGPTVLFRPNVQVTGDTPNFRGL